MASVEEDTTNRAIVLAYAHTLFKLYFMCLIKAIRSQVIPIFSQVATFYRSCS